MLRQCVVVRVIALLLVLLQGLDIWASDLRRHSPARTSPPVGELPRNEPQLLVRTDVCDCDANPTTADVTLATVGVEHTVDGQTTFHPYVSIALDKTYTADDGGQWLAVWNLGMSPPGVLARLRAFIPGCYAAQKASPERIAELERIRADVPAALQAGIIKPPPPYLEATQRYTGSNWRIFFTALKYALRVTNFGAQFVARTYFLNWKDYQERYFQQAYLALDWYAEVADDEDGALSLDQVNDLKFRLLTNRSAYGHWVDEDDALSVVSGYESHVRRWQAKTSSFLHIAANEYHLGYTELMRPRRNRPPVPVCGILYYDPELAPAEGAIRWPARNPFDLTHNPFTYEPVQRLARQFPGQRIPLALYVFETDLLVKPIIVIDFFRRDNPRRRQTMATTKRLTDQALASTTVGFLFKLVNHLINYAANKTAFTYLATKTSRLGVEEMRLSLRSGLYFDPDFSQQWLDELDRVILNPLLKPGREEKLIAEINYEALRANGAQAVCQVVRRVREKRVRQLSGNKDRPLTPADVQLYQRHLMKQPHLKLIRAFLRQWPMSGISLDKLHQALNPYIEWPDRTDEQARRAIFDLRLKLLSSRPLTEQDKGRSEENWSKTLDLCATALRKLYEADGLTVAQLERDTQRALKEQTAQDIKQIKKAYEQQVWSFQDNLKKQRRFLKSFWESHCDVRRYSPSYWQQALEFFSAVPAATASNSRIREIYQKHAEEIRLYLTRIAQHLAAPPEAADDRLAVNREASLEAARQITQMLFENRRTTRSGEDED